jgi:hypothetical protein
VERKAYSNGIAKNDNIGLGGDYHWIRYVKDVKTTGIEKNLFLFTFLLFIALHLFLMGAVRIYPFLDMPNHLALATIYRFHGEPTNQFVQYYSLNVFLKPNVFHLLFCGSKIFPGVEFGNKIYYLLYALLFPLSTILVIRKLGGNQWFSLLSFLLLYNCNVCYGFTGLTMSIPFVLLVFYFLIDYLENENTWTKFVLTVLFVLLFFMHVLAALFSLLVFFTFCLYRNKDSLTKVLKEISVTIPVLILIITWWMYETAEFSDPGLVSSLFDYYKDSYIRSLALRGGLLVHDNFRLYGGLLGYSIASFFSLFIIGLALYFMVLNRKSLKYKIEKSTFKAVCLFTLCSLGCCLFMPSTLPGYSFLFQRFSVFFLLSMIILGSIVSSEKLHRITILSMCFVCLVHFVLWADCFSDFEKENRFFTKNIFPSNTEGKKMAALIYDYRFREISVYDNFVDYYIVWRKGIATTRCIDEKSFPVRRKASKESLPPYIKWVGKHNNYDGRYADMDYILVRGELPKEAKGYMVNFKTVKKEGKWVLYERKEHVSESDTG